MGTKKQFKQLTKTPEFRAIVQILSPEYMWSAARHHGDGDPILGAPDAMIETRGVVRSLIRSARERYREEDGTLPSDLEMALLLRHMGWPIWSKFKRLEPIVEGNEGLLYNSWFPEGGSMHGGFFLYKPTPSAIEDVYYQITYATSRMLSVCDNFNRAVLDGRVWQRKDGMVMCHYLLRPGIQSIIMDATGSTGPSFIEQKYKKGLRRVAKFNKSELGKVASKLMSEWAKTGFIGSPAGAMVSMSPNTPVGVAPIPYTVGIPLVITVNEVQNGLGSRCFIGINIDHRAFNGDQAGQIYRFIRNYMEGQGYES